MSHLPPSTQPPAPQLAVVGDSHANCIKRANNASGRNAKTINIVAFSGDLIDNFVSHDREHGIIMNPLIRHTLWSLGLVHQRSQEPVENGPKELILLFGSAEYHRLAFLPIWDRYTINDSLHVPLEIRQAKHALPVDLIDAWVLRRHSRLWEGITILKSWGLPISVLAGPPPTRDAHLIKARQSWVKVVTDEWTRLALHRSIVGNLQNMTDTLAIPFRQAPSSCMDSDGFLADECLHDGIHANVEYGSRILAELDCLSSVSMTNASDRPA